MHRRREALSLGVLATIVLASLVLPSAGRAGVASWNDTDLGGAPVSAPGVAADGARRWVYFEGAGGHLFGVARDLGQPFGAPFDTGIAIQGTPSALVLASDRVRVFFRGPNDHLSFVEGDGQTFGATTDLGVQLDAGPSAVLDPSGAEHVFYRGANGDLFESATSGGGWSAPADLGTWIAAGPAAVVPASAPDRIEVYAPDASGKLARGIWDGTAWRFDVALGDVTLAESVAAVSRRAGRTTLFYRQAGELVRRTAENGVFAAPEPTGVPASSAPGASWPDEAFALEPDGRLHRALAAPALVFPSYARVWGTATHNSYWINRDHRRDPFASGTQELISDQLLHEHARALEIDVHTDDGHPGVWTVYHTDTPSNSTVHTLRDVVETLRAFHYAVPEHEVVNVVIELKNTNLKLSPPLATENTFLADHTIDEFDRTFRDGLGATLYTPADLLARCAPGSTLARAAEVAGWPTTDELRGKFIINVIGNWSNAYHDWYRYAGEGDIARRVAFPLRSIFDDAGEGLSSWPGSAHDPVPAAWVQPARDASVFWQVEDLGCPLVPAFLARNGVVRGADSFDVPAQDDRIGRGFGFVQTDYPWSMTQDTAPAGLPTDPSRRLRDPSPITGAAPIDPAALEEPGERLYVSTDATPRFLYAKVKAPVRWLETTVSTTRIGDTYGLSYPRKAQEDGLGGIRAAVSARDYVEVLRVKTGHSGDGPGQEKLTLRVAVCRGGSVKTFDRVASPYGTDAVGNLIALEVDATGPGSIVRAYSAGRIDRATGQPAWTLLRAEKLAGRAVYQGLVATHDVLFVGSRAAERRKSHALGVRDLPRITDQATVVDLSWPARSSRTPVVAPIP